MGAWLKYPVETVGVLLTAKKRMTTRGIPWGRANALWRHSTPNSDAI